MQPYSYLGASWAANANNQRQASQQASQFGSHAFQQGNQLRMQRRQLAQQRGLNALGQRDKQFSFGINALAGLMR